MVSEERVFGTIDEGKLVRVLDKVMVFLMRKTRSVGEAYEVSRYLRIFLEEAYHCEAVSPTDAQVRQQIRTWLLASHSS
jgi:hypothetical protein